MIGQDSAEQRIAKRFDKAFQVTVFSELFGEMVAVARNISSGGICLEMQESLPMACVVTIQFRFRCDSTVLSVRAEVKHQYYFNYNVGDQARSTRGIGLRFLEFLEDREDNPHQSFTRRRNLH